MNVRIGNRLRELRKEKEMTLQQVADILGMTPTAISGYEKAKRNPSNEIITKLADIYETTVDDIFGITTEEQSNMKSILNTKKLHWDGIELKEDELNFIKQFLEMQFRDRHHDDDKDNSKPNII